MKTYSELLNRLYSVNIHNGVKLGLSNIKSLCKAFDNPERKFSSVHVAGTNGKGSVSTKIAYTIELQGKRTGLFTSPHISTFRERIRINSKMIPESTVQDILEKIFTIIDENNIPATFFEITTLLAFIYFAEQNVDMAVLETGLGGRLDSTNVVIPKLTVITSISLDHTEILGYSLKEITTEKAGIIKEGCPLVIGPKVPGDIISPIANENNCHFEQITGPFENFNVENSAIARRCLEILDVPSEFINRGILELPPCRMEQIPLTNLNNKCQPHAIILVVAHNPDGLEYLLSSLRSRYPQKPLRFVCGLSKNKDLQSCASVLAHFGSSFHCIAANNFRALPAKLLSKALQNAGVKANKLFLKPTLIENLDLAVECAGKNDEVLIVCGSFFIMGEVRNYFGITEPQDPYELNENSSVDRVDEVDKLDLLDAVDDVDKVD
jgi:dihydrofolate synthase/folylpolyglutamate synthase